MTLSETLRGSMTLVVFSTLFGALVGFVISKLTNKTARLRYSTTVERVGMAADDPVFGSVRITWNDGASVRNLHLVTVEVENESSRDFEDVGLTVYCEKETQLLTERTGILNSPNILHWSPAFQQTLGIANGQEPTQYQWDTYHHRREYIVPVFNRGQILHLTYLCTRPNDEKAPAVFMHTQLKGARLDHQPRRNFIHGVPTQKAIIYGLGISLITAGACAQFLHGARLASIICIVVGLFAQSFGAGAYKLRKFAWKLLTG